MTLILATGGLGFIGSHTCLTLLENNFDVLIVDSLVNCREENFIKIKKIKNLKKIKGKIFFRYCDIRRDDLLEEIFLEFKNLSMPVSAVIHFAGLKSVNESVLDPLRYWDVNVNITLSLLKVMKKFSCFNLVFSSSATIYKASSNKKLDESASLSPINAYGNSKLTIERILNDLHNSESSSWRIINLRYFNPVGCHESGFIGETPKGKPNNIFPIILDVINNKTEKFFIFGDDWPTYDGTCVRDYIHVMDLAEAHVSALNFLIDNKPQIKNINVGTGIGTSVLELVNTFNENLNTKINYEFSSRRAGDASFVVANNELALKLLSWSPKRKLEDMCIDSLRWLENLEKNLVN